MTQRFRKCSISASTVIEGITHELTEKSVGGIEESPTREEVVDYAVLIGFEQDEVEERLSQSQEWGHIDVDEHGHVWMK